MRGNARSIAGLSLLIVFGLTLLVNTYPGASSDPGSVSAWIGTGYGMNCLDSEGWHTFAERQSSLPSNQIKDIAIDTGGRVWIAHSRGLSVIHGGTWQDFGNAWGQGSPEALAVDGKGGVWLAYFGGVSHYDGSRWTTYEAKQLGSGQNVNMVKDVCTASDGGVWVATTNSLASFNGDTWTVFEKNTGFDRDYYFTQVAVDGEARVWAAHGSGVLMFDGQKWVSHTDPFLSQAQDFAIDSAGRLWVGTYARGVSMFGGRGWLTYTRENSGLSSGHVTALTADGRGRIWIGTQWGLCVFDGEAWSAYHMHTADLVDNEIAALAVTGDGPPLPDPAAKAPGLLAGRLVRGKEPVSGAAVEVGTEFAGLLFTGPTPFSTHPFHRSVTTDEQGSFLFASLPVGRYNIAFRAPGGKWMLLTGFFRIGGKKVTVEEYKTTDLGEIDLGK